MRNDALARRAHQVGLDECVITADSKPVVSPKMAATTFEAVIGAVYQDGGNAAVQRVMQSLGFFDHELPAVTSQNPLFPVMNSDAILTDVQTSRSPHSCG